MSVDTGVRKLQAATITFDEFCRRVRDGWKGKPYDYRNTLYYKGVVEVRAAENTTPASAPVPSAASNPYAKKLQNVVYCAQRSEAALAAPKHMVPALTLDPAYAAWATPDIVSKFRIQGRPAVAGWFVQTQVPVQQAKDTANRLGLDYIIYQGETSEEYRTAIEAGAKLIVGNANAWTDAQRQDAAARIGRGELAFAQEAYTNLGNPWPESTSSGGVPACSLVLGAYDGSSEVPGRGWNPSLAEYKQHTPAPVWATVSVYHAAGVNQNEWGLLA